MPGLVPGIYVLAVGGLKDVDGRGVPGHDEFLIAPGMLEPNGGLRVNARWRPAASHWHALLASFPHNKTDRKSDGYH
jgi:hypothetical protein